MGKKPYKQNPNQHSINRQSQASHTSIYIIL